MSYHLSSMINMKNILHNPEMRMLIFLFLSYWVQYHAISSASCFMVINALFTYNEIYRL